MNNKNLSTDSIKQLLDHSAAHIDQHTAETLCDARARALENHRTQESAPVLAWLGQHGLWSGNPKYLQRAFALLFVACLIGSFAYLQHINDHEHDPSEIDVAILTDELPLDAYVE